VPKDRLDSWKAIAGYLERSLRTVQRWHASHGLPVHHFGGSKSSVFAFTEEIDRWLVGLAEKTRSTPMGEDEGLAAREKKSRELTASAEEMWETRSERNIQTVAGLYRKAIDEHAGNAAAFVGLANAMAFSAMHGIMDGTVAYPRALEALRRVAQLQPEDLDAKCSAAWLNMLYERNWRQARAGFEEVLDKQPRLSFALSGRALLHIAEGKVSEASRYAWEAWKRNPLACSLGALLCWVQYLDGDFDRALELGAQVRASGGGGAMVVAMEALALIQTGPIAPNLKRIQDLAGEYPQSLTLQGTLGYAYAISGQTKKAEGIFQDLGQMSELKKRNHGYALALVLIGMDQRREAVSWLEAAYAEGALCSLAFRSDPILRPLRGEPQFDLLLRKIGPTAGNGFQTRASVGSIA
jgi:serine/threonine-protein kinase